MDGDMNGLNKRSFFYMMVLFVASIWEMNAPPAANAETPTVSVGIRKYEWNDVRRLRTILAL
jgi:hypothetical protein